VTLRTSARPPKPSAKKRSSSHYQQHAPCRSKKPKTSCRSKKLKAHSSTVSTMLDPVLSTQSNTGLIEISDKEEEEQEEEQEEQEDEEDEDEE